MPEKILNKRVLCLLLVSLLVFGWAMSCSAAEQMYMVSESQLQRLELSEQQQRAVDAIDRAEKAAGEKQLEVAKEFQRMRKNSLLNICSEKGILLRVNRSIQVEGAFGVLKENYGFRRFLTRGEPNIRVEMLFLALAYNLNKLHNKHMQGRIGQQLHKLAA